MSRDVERWERDHRFLRAFGDLLGVEGGYANIAGDAGGETIFGVASRYHPELWADGPPRLDQAAALAYADYWQPAGCDRIAHYGVAFLTFDIAYNSSVQDSVQFLQESVNLWRPEAEEIVEDGRFGPATQRAVNGLRHQRALAMYLAGERLEEIRQRIRERPDQRKFLASWGNRLRAAIDSD